MPANTTATATTETTPAETPQTKEQLIQEFRIQTIQDAAARVIASKGLNGATMQAIADAAGIAKGTIYLYFQSRKELVERTADQAFSQLLALTREILESPAPVRERLRGMIANQISYFEERRDFFQLYESVRYPNAVTEEGRHAESRHARIEIAQHRLYLERLTSFLEEAMAAGEIREMDASRLALFVSEGIIAILIRRLTHEEETVPVEDDVDWLVRAIMDGIATEKERS